MKLLCTQKCCRKRCALQKSTGERIGVLLSGPKFGNNFSDVRTKWGDSKLYGFWGRASGALTHLGFFQPLREISVFFHDFFSRPIFGTGHASPGHRGCEMFGRQNPMGDRHKTARVFGTRTAGNDRRFKMEHIAGTHKHPKV